ncbi:dihydrolipoamide acetyltransferase family protein [Neobacillus bataviensis]|uniref:dihydrolipoamide acetyltransferase family protein n=1 Tax=Neobacillus bataviensis TaxID=220685 RepID=UPI001CC03AC0|nr:dihydrolipoamide acetyltransferase family protein [Neobacillus bataviensis]
MYEVKMPRLGVTMQNGTVSNWIYEEGDTVEKGDYLFELETEKSTLEIESQTSGVLKKIIIPEGEEVPVNTVIAIIAAEDEEVDLSVYTKSNTSNEEVAAAVEALQPAVATKQPEVQTSKGAVSPKARKLAKELGVAVENLVGTGKNGLITEDNVRQAASTNTSIKIKEKIALNNIKRAMSENMLESWRNVPQFTQMVSVNMEKVLSAKKELEGVSLNDILVKAVSKAVKTNPIVNSRLEENQIVVFDEVNISVAVNSQHGLVVPVVKNTENKSVAEIAKEIRSLAQKAEQNQLTLNDYSNGTITVSNLGSLGIETGTPIINAPQSTLVFAGAIRKTPVVNENNEIVVEPIMTLSICYDHRFIDGVTGAKFTNEVKNVLENLTADGLL